MSGGGATFTGMQFTAAALAVTGARWEARGAGEVWRHMSDDLQRLYITDAASDVLDELTAVVVDRDDKTWTPGVVQEAADRLVARAEGAPTDG
jgi:hypothetical protein